VEDAIWTLPLLSTVRQVRPLVPGGGIAPRGHADCPGRMPLPRGAPAPWPWPVAAAKTGRPIPAAAVKDQPSDLGRRGQRPAVPIPSPRPKT